MVKQNEPQRIKKLFDKLNNSKYFLIPEMGKISVSAKQGVYIILDENKNVLHVGKTNGAVNGLNQRILNHVLNQSSFSKLYMQINKVALRGSGYFKFIEIECPRERALLEALTAGLLCPAHIGTGVKKLL